MNERDIENLQLATWEIERTIRDLQYRVQNLETALVRIDRTLEKIQGERIGSIWKAIRRLEEKEIQR